MILLLGLIHIIVGILFYILSPIIFNWVASEWREDEDWWMSILISFLWPFFIFAAIPITIYVFVVRGIKEIFSPFSYLRTLQRKVHLWNIKQPKPKELLLPPPKPYTNYREMDCQSCGHPVVK